MTNLPPFPSSSSGQANRLRVTVRKNLPGSKGGAKSQILHFAQDDKLDVYCHSEEAKPTKNLCLDFKKGSESSSTLSPSFGRRGRTSPEQIFNCACDSSLTVNCQPVASGGYLRYNSSQVTLVGGVIPHSMDSVRPLAAPPQAVLTPFWITLSFSIPSIS